MDADKKRLWVSGQFVEVTDEIYDAYMIGVRKMRYFESDLKADRFLMDEKDRSSRSFPAGRILWTGSWMIMQNSLQTGTKASRTWCYAGFLLSGCIKRLIHSRKGKES